VITKLEEAVPSQMVNPKVLTSVSCGKQKQGEKKNLPLMVLYALDQP
jgi:hypothetical protein